MSLIENERTKLTANLLDALAAGFTITGGLAPVVAFLIGAVRVGAAAIVASSLVCICAGFILHLAGRYVLRRLRP